MRAIYLVDTIERGSQLVLLDEVSCIQRPTNVKDKQSLFPVTSSNERSDPFVMLDTSPRRQYPHILEPLGVETRELKVEDPKCVPLIQDEISWGEVGVGEYKRQR